MAKRFGVLFFFLLFTFILNAFLNPFPQKVVPERVGTKIGTSYSFEQAAWYGRDPKKAYVDFLETYKFDFVRLPFFWDDPKSLEYLEFATAEAQKRDLEVIIALGLKTPYHPEYHLPSNISAQMEFGQTIDINHPVASELLKIDEQVVKTLAKYDNIIYWQVENEPFLANVNNWEISLDLIEKEVELVRKLDSKKRPIILSHVGPPVFDVEWKRFFKVLKPGDVLGVNAYFKSQGTNLFSFNLGKQAFRIPWPKLLVWPVQSWYFLSPNYEYIQNYAKQRDVEVWVLEMQAEPYIRTLEDARKNKHFFEPADIKKGRDFVVSYDIDAIGLWGVNYWQFRDGLGDSSWKNTVLEVLVNR